MFLETRGRVMVRLVPNPSGVLAMLRRSLQARPREQRWRIHSSQGRVQSFL